MTDTLSAHAAYAPPRRHLDVGLFIGLIAAGVVGVVVVYSATRQSLIAAGENPHYYLERQGLFLVLGVAVMYAVSRFDYRRLEVVATTLYLLSIVALAGVFVVGRSAYGADRWYSFGSFLQIQPSEFSVLILIIMIATYCGRRTEGLKMRDVWRLLMLSAVPLLLIFRQPDLGTTVILVLIVAALLTVAGVPPRFLALLTILGGAGLVAGVFLDVLQRYQIDRFVSFVNQNSHNPAVAQLLYEVNNSKAAIGSGGLHGAGLFHGLQTNLGYVPNQQTDFIFTVIGEQLGFIGSTIVILLLAFVAFRMFMIARNAREVMGRLLCTGIFIFFAFSCFENIGMTMGIMPVTGIPLPLISYGGSQVLVFCVAGGLVLSVSRRAVS